MTAFLKFFDLVPGWVWALICAAALAFAGWQEVRLADERADHRHDIAQFQGERTKAATAQSVATGRVLDLERDMAKLKSQLESTDAKLQAATQQAAVNLAAARAVNGGRVRDPFAVPCPASGAAVGAVAGAGASAPDGGQASGLLSAELSDFLDARFKEADAINDAYAICKQDALNVRDARARAKFSP